MGLQYRKRGANWSPEMILLILLLSCVTLITLLHHSSSFPPCLQSLSSSAIFFSSLYSSLSCSLITEWRTVIMRWLSISSIIGCGGQGAQAACRRLVTAYETSCFRDRLTADVQLFLPMQHVTREDSKWCKSIIIHTTQMPYFSVKIQQCPRGGASHSLQLA